MTRRKFTRARSIRAASADLIKILDANEFRRLRQEEIVSPWIAGNIDPLAVLVARPEGAQKFEFLDKTSREPFRGAIDFLCLAGWIGCAGSRTKNSAKRRGGITAFHQRA